MGLKFIPNNILRRMYPEERKPLGKAGVLPEEVDQKAAKIAEKKLQEQCENWLRLHDLFYLRMPMHKATAIRVGWPDFLVILPNQRAVLVEIKVEGGRLSDDQKYLHREFTRQCKGRVWLVVNFDQFVFVVGRELEACGNIGGCPETPSTSQSGPASS